MSPTVLKNLHTRFQLCFSQTCGFVPRGEIFANKQFHDPFNPRIKPLFLFIAFFEYHENFLATSPSTIFSFFFLKIYGYIENYIETLRVLFKNEKKPNFFFILNCKRFRRIKISMKKFRIGHFCFGIASILINGIFHVCYRSMKMLKNIKTREYRA